MAAKMRCFTPKSGPKKGKKICIKSSGKKKGKRKGGKRTLTARQKAGFALGRIIGMQKVTLNRMDCAGKAKAARDAADSLAKYGKYDNASLVSRARASFEKIVSAAKACGRGPAQQSLPGVNGLSGRRRKRRKSRR